MILLHDNTIKLQIWDTVFSFYNFRLDSNLSRPLHEDIIGMLLGLSSVMIFPVGKALFMWQGGSRKHRLMALPVLISFWLEISLINKLSIFLFNLDAKSRFNRV